jgi:site-specific DNA recombinase
MRCAIYRRVSTRRQVVTGASLDEQLEACRSHAERQGWHVVVDFCEQGRSAYMEDLQRRPQFQALRDAAARREFDVVIVYELSRFARRQKVQFGVGEDLEKLGVRLVSVTEQFDLATVEGFVVYSMLAMQAELHSRLLSRRITAVRAREVSQGRLAMRAPRGMRWGEQGLEPTDDPALIIRAYDLAVQGIGTDAQLRILHGEGHHISRSSLHYLLRNPAYTGLLRHKGQLYPAAWKPIISRATWEAVQEIRAGRRPENPVRAGTRSSATLAGLAFCANCGAKLHYENHPPPKRSYFRCSCRQNGGHCNAHPSRADRLDAAMDAFVRSLSLPPDLLEEAQARAVRAVATPQRPSEEPAIRESLRRLGRAYADGAIEDAEYEARHETLMRRLAAAVAAPAPATDPAPVIAMLGDLPRLWDATTPQERRRLLGQLVGQVYARRSAIYAIRPTRAAAHALPAVWQQCRAVDNSSLRNGHTLVRGIILLAA